MDLNLQSTIELPGGARLPRFGLGVWQCPGFKARDASLHALRQGYRLIDTAAIYGNEKDVGEAVRQSGIDRKDIFVTTKLWTADHDAERLPKAFEESLKRLNIGYVDLYLSHFPVAGRRIGAWKTMQLLVRTGYCRAVGVSNYTVAHLTELIEKTGVVPAVNQVEMHPWLVQDDLIRFCRDKRIVIQAYSPLAHGQRLNDPRLAQIAGKYQRTPAQILIRWGLQHGFSVIPKSSRPERIEENAGVFDFALFPDDMKMLNAMHENLRTCWDPTDEP